MSPPDQVPDTTISSLLSPLTTSLVLTVVPADGRGVPQEVVAGGAGELRHSSQAVTLLCTEAGADLAVVEGQAGTPGLSHGQEEGVGVASLTGAPELPAVLHRHVLELQSVDPVLVRAGGGPAAGELPGGVLPGPLRGPAGPPEDAVEDEAGPRADHHLPPSPQHLGPPSHSPLYPGRETLWGK